MNKATIKRFIAWLERADRGEIIQKRREFEETLADVRSREAKAASAWGLGSSTKNCWPGWIWTAFRRSGNRRKPAALFQAFGLGRIEAV